MKNYIIKICLLLVLAVGLFMPMAVFAEDGWVNDSNAPDWWTDPNGSKYSYDDTQDQKSSNETDESDVSSNESNTQNTTSVEDITFDKDSIAIILLIVFYIVISILKTASENSRERHMDMDASTMPLPVEKPKEQINNIQTSIKEYLPNMTEVGLSKDLARKFVALEEARMNFDYDKLHLLCDNELYKSYKVELEDLQKRKHQHVVSKINPTVSRIIKIYKENDRLMAIMIFTASFSEYVINTETGEVVEGNKEAKKYNNYELYFKYAITSRTRNCPNCGSELKIDDEKCYYCHALINNSYEDFVLTKVIKHE